MIVPKDTMRKLRSGTAQTDHRVRNSLAPLDTALTGMLAGPSATKITQKTPRAGPGEVGRPNGRGFSAAVRTYSISLRAQCCASPSLPAPDF